jgi:hypothetical protein
MPIDVRAAQAALDRLIAVLPGSAAEVSSKMAHEAQVAARAGLTNPTGPLAESIRTEGPDQIGAMAYRTKVGPTLIYGRQRELGGPIDPVNASMLTAHFRAPGYWMWDYGRGLEDVFTFHVNQFGQHYLKRGVEISMPAFLRIARKVWGDLMRKAA